VVIVIFLILAWFSIGVMASLPNKLPLAANFLLVLVIEFLLTNKLTLLSFNFKLFEINTSSIPHFLSMILQNDITVPFILLTYVNVFLTATKASVRWGISAYGFLFQMFTGAMLRWYSVLTYTGWNFLMEAVMIIALMSCTLLTGRFFQRMMTKEGWIR
jgi:hypothetical protein